MANFYKPRAISLVPGVQRNEWGPHADQYIGTGDALERSGVLTAAMLPLRYSASWQPEGARARGTPVHLQPGYLHITRHPDGLYRANLTLSHAEQAARKAASEANRKAQGIPRNPFAHMAPDAFLTELSKGVMGAARFILRHTEDSAVGDAVFPHRISADTWNETLCPLFSRLLLELKHARVEMADDSLRAARSDTAFQQFLSEQCLHLTPGAEDGA